MKLYFFETGHLGMDKSSFTAGRGFGTRWTTQIPFFLIRHPKGNLLYDTGMPKDVANYWPGEAVSYLLPEAKPELYCVNQLEKLGVKPDDIKYIVQSHLHLDHAGGLKDFPNSTVLVQRKEREWAYTADLSMRHAYIRTDFDHPHIRYRHIEGWKDNPFDVFCDGSVLVLFTPGHTPGHQSLLVKLPKSGPFLLTGDACYCLENLDEDVMPGIIWDLEETEKSLEKMRHMRENGVKIIIGHDPGDWPNYKKAPEFYE